MAVYTFLERFDFTGKTILPFCTHEGSGLGHSEADIRRLCHGAKVGKGLLPSTAPPCAGRSGPWRPGSKEETNMDLNTLKEKQPLPRGEENTAFAAYFDGTSYLNMLTTQQVPIGNVTFEPGAGTTGTSTRPPRGAGRSCWSPPAGGITRSGANPPRSSTRETW